MSVVYVPLIKLERCSAREKKKIAVSRPNIISMYIRYKEGDDRLDENISLYSTAIRGKKWYFLLFCYGLHVCENNAWLLAQADDYADNMLAITYFIVKCQLEYAEYGIPPKSLSRQRLSATFFNRAAQFDQIGHYMVKSDPQRRKQCKHCRSQTIFIYMKYDIAIHLKYSLE